VAFGKRLQNVSRTFVKNLRLHDRSTYSRDRSWYSLTHMLKACDVLSDISYNTSTIVRGGDHGRSWGKIANIPSSVN
jgi:hypothetical protein